MKHTFKSGGVWEDKEWSIETNYEQQLYEHDNIPCKHCGPSYTKKNLTHVYELETGKYSEYYKTETYYRIPAVVIGVNEGGYNSTGICLDCILEAAAGLPRLHETK